MEDMQTPARPKPSRLVAVGLLGAGLLAGGTLATLGVASASGNNANAAAKPAPSGPPQQGRRGAGMGRALHGSETVQTGPSTYSLIDNQVGLVTANDGTIVTIRSVDGFSATYAFDANSRVRKDRAKAAISDLKVGDKVRLRATEQAGGNPIVTIALDGLGRPAGAGDGAGHGPGQPPELTATPSSGI